MAREELLTKGATERNKTNPKFLKAKTAILMRFADEDVHPEDFPCNDCPKETSLCQSAWELRFWLEHCPIHKRKGEDY